MNARAARAGFALSLLAALWLAAVPCAHAQAVRAWLDRDRIALGETTTLHIEVDGAADAEPDYAPLLRDFVLSGRSSSRSLLSDASGTRVHAVYAVELEPRRVGTLAVPALAVGARRTTPLSLQVAPAAAAPARAGDAVFVESEADATAPYVQQAVGYVVRLYLGVPLVSGELLQPEPDGATLRQVGDDVRYQRDVQGRRYTVIERHYLLVPERSGPLEVPGPRFTGRGIGGFFDDVFGGGQRALRAGGAPLALAVRGIPAGAPQPWLPLRGLSLRWTSKPATVRAGEAATVALELVADGAMAAQLPELALPAVAGAQVFPDAARRDDAFVSGRPQATVSRSFAVVPARAGTLRIEAPRLAWWDARAGAARVATLPALELAVSPGTASPAGGPAAASPAGASGVPAGSERGAAAGDGWMRVPGVQGRVRTWAFVAVVFALLWLLTFMWGLHRHPHPAPRTEPVPGSGSRGGRAPRARDASGALRRALAQGTLGAVAEALRAAAVPPVDSLDALRARLADPAQQAAVEALQRALWGGGDGTAARSALREAFAAGPRWARPTDAPARGPLPPLYP